MTIKTENLKIKNCNIFSLPPVKTCVKAQCQKYCYSIKSRGNAPSVKRSRGNNLRASQGKNFPDRVVEILNRKKFQTTRIHEAGDFYSRDYIQKWYEVARQLPQHKFFCYTKRSDLFNDKLLSAKPNNINLFWSVDGIKEDVSEGMDESAYAMAKGFDGSAIVTRNPSQFDCQADHKNVFCVKDCKRCVENKEVVSFILH